MRALAGMMSAGASIQLINPALYRGKTPGTIAARGKVGFSIAAFNGLGYDAEYVADEMSGRSLADNFLFRGFVDQRVEVIWNGTEFEVRPEAVATIDVEES